MDILDLVFRARTQELDQAEKKLDNIGKKAEQAEKKSKGLNDALGGFSKVGGPLGSVADKVSDVTDKVGDATGAFGRLGGAVTLIGTAAATAVAATVGLTLKIADAADAMNDLSNRTNVSTERLSLIDATAKMAGSSVDELVSSSERLASKLAKQDEESGKAVTALKALGISTKDANGEMKSMLSLQEEIVLAVDKATDKSKAEGAALQLLGTDYYKLRTAIKETAEQKSEMYDYMQKVGVLTTTTLARESDNLNDKIGKLGLAFKGMGTSVATAVLPYLNSLLDKVIAIGEKAADIIRRFTGGSTASELSGDALSKLQTERDNALATVRKLEGSEFANTSQGAKALAQARAQVTAINDQIREMTRLKDAADAAAASVKAAVTDGKPGEGNRPVGGVGGSNKDKKTPKDDSAAAVAAAAAKEQAIFDEAWKFYNDHVMKNAEATEKQAAAFQKQADAVRDMLDPARALNREIESINNNPLLSQDEKGAAIVGLSLKWQESMDKMKESTSGLNDLATFTFDTLGNVISDMVTGAELDFKTLARSFVKAVFDMLVVQPMLESLKKSFGGAGGSGGGGVMNIVMGAIGSFFGGARATGGPVSSGRMYQVNERGPELLNVGNKQFLMMGSQPGYVTPNGGSSAGSKVQVVVNNFSGQEVRTEESVDSRGNRRIELTVGELNASELRRPGSSSHQAIRQSFGARPALVRR